MDSPSDLFAESNNCCVELMEDKGLKTGCIGLMSTPNGPSRGRMGCGSVSCTPILAGPLVTGAYWKVGLKEFHSGCGTAWSTFQFGRIGGGHGDKDGVNPGGN